MTFDPDSLISSYLDGGLSPTDAQALCAWVKASPQNALRFSRRALVHGLSRQYFIGQDVTSIAESEGQELDRLLDPPPTEIDISLVLDEVRRSLEIQHHRRSVGVAHVAGWSRDRVEWNASDPNGPVRRTCDHLTAQKSSSWGGGGSGRRRFLPQ